MTPKRAAIFDLDGTLVDSMLIHTKAWKRVFSESGLSLTDEELLAQSGRKNIEFAEQMIVKRGVDNLDYEEIASLKDRAVNDFLSEKRTPFFTGAEELLDLLKTKNIPLALATSATKNTAYLLAGEEGLSYFQVRVFGEDVSRGKPNPEIFLKAANELGFEPQECIVFEDTLAGVTAAKDGGFFCIAKDNNIGQDLSRADLIIKDYEPGELIKLFA